MARPSVPTSSRLPEAAIPARPRSPSSSSPPTGTRAAPIASAPLTSSGSPAVGRDRHAAQGSVARSLPTPFQGSAAPRALEWRGVAAPLLPE
eukprot:5979839-Alexandrium_andersonii.AAC.1